MALLALLAGMLSRSTQRSYLRYWAMSWACMALALSALYLSLVLGRLGAAAQTLYFLGEYAAGYLLVAGCRNYVDGRGPPQRALLWLLPAALLAAVLAFAGADFTARFGPQAAIMAGFFGWALVSLRPALHSPRRRLGLRITTAALAILTVLFAIHAAMAARTELLGMPMPFYYSAYLSIYNLLFEVVLGFGLVTLAMEDVNNRLEQSIRELAGARDGMERLAHHDPLTEALNRHAFASMLEHRRGAAQPGGSVALVDIDKLKPLNDAHGHAAGDAAIRAVAKALRSVLRPDDPLFRWGGDEFLLVMQGLPVAEARVRLAPLQESALRVSLPGGNGSLDVRISIGVADLPGIDRINAAVAAADAEMYRYKGARRG
ncbi:MAG: GGDEF domain-containing protein [Nevskia sp.]|nr:GGDEF domain-containing protein [Nevskia sp.]